jgi:crossover junction endodeoxyribonuclease RuvC
MKLLAIDPGFDRLGIAVMEKKTGGEILIYSECFSPSKKLSREERMTEVGKKIKKIIKKHKPKILALEDLFLNKNHKTVMAVSETKGVIIYESVLAGLEIHKYTPLQIKVAVTGYGRSDKNQVINMVKKIMRLRDTRGGSDDEYDAIAIGLTFFAYFKPHKLLSTDF